MDQVPLFSRLFLGFAPLTLTILLARWFGWRGLLAALALSFGLLQTVANLQGEPFSPGGTLGESENPAIRAAYTGAFWGWITGLACAVSLFTVWCRAHLRAVEK